MAPFSRTTIVAIRLSSLLISITSLVLFIIVLLKVIDNRFPSVRSGITALPVGGLSAAILWNVAISILTLTRLKISPVVPLFIDLSIVVALAVLGVIGFVHDDQNYLSNGTWAQNRDPAWLTLEIVAMVLLCIAV
jgi:hypothetical protein